MSTFHPRRSPASHDRDARARLRDVAYELFEVDGIETVGIDRIVSDANVAKSTLYRHFPSKDDLIVSALELHEELWTIGWLEKEIYRRATTPEGHVLAIFDAFDDWFNHPDFHGCFFVNTLLETHDTLGPVRDASIKKLSVIRTLLTQLATELKTPEPDEFARRLHILMIGSIISAVMGDEQAARRAKPLAEALLAARHTTLAT